MKTGVLSVVIKNSDLAKRNIFTGTMANFLSWMMCPVSSARIAASNILKAKYCEILKNDLMNSLSRVRKRARKFRFP